MGSYRETPWKTHAVALVLVLETCPAESLKSTTESDISGALVLVWLCQGGDVAAHVWVEAMYRVHAPFRRICFLLAIAEMKLCVGGHISVFRPRSFCGAKTASSIWDEEEKDPRDEVALGV